jgi:hypothetical protein
VRKNQFFSDFRCITFANKRNEFRVHLYLQQTGQVVREVQASPEGRMQSVTREALDKQVQTTHNVSWVKARDEVDGLEHSARLLPQEITAVGVMNVPAQAAAPPVTVNVDPALQVNVQPPAAREEGYDAAMKQASALGGSGLFTEGNT